MMCGFRSFFAQMRCTVLCEMPTWRLMLRTLQRAAGLGRTRDLGDDTRDFWPRK